MKGPADLWKVAKRLGDLVDEVVFVGGMIRELLMTDPAAGPARPTRDVDCIVNVVSWGDYVRLSRRLRGLGFAECQDEGAPICRWVIDDARVDVMPVDPAVLGFSNVWYPSTVQHAIRVDGPDGYIRIADAAHFCGTKIESFLARGEGNYYHHDMEDLLALVDGREELPADVARAPGELREFIGEEIGEWLGDEVFVESLAGHLYGDAASQARRPILLARLQQLAAFSVGPAVPTRAAPEAPGRAAPQTSIRPAITRRVGRGQSQPIASGTSSARVLLRSTNLRAAEYDSVTQVLTIEFQSGAVYAYRGVPHNVYAGLLQAASHGRYFNQWVKGRYVEHRLI